MLGISTQSCRTVWSHSLRYEDPDSPAHSHEIGSGNQTNSMHWRWKRTVYNRWGSSLPPKNWASFARSPLKIFDARSPHKNLWCRTSMRRFWTSADPLQCQPLFRKASVSLLGMRKFWRKRLAAPRKLRKRGYTPQRRCAPLSHDYHQNMRNSWW